MTHDDRHRARGRDLDAYVETWNAITPDEPTTVEQQRERRERDPRRLYALAVVGGTVVGCGFAGPSDSPGRGFLAPRVLPEARRRGVGKALLRELAAHLETCGFETASSHVDGHDPGSLTFARRFASEEVDRQVEQVKVVGDELKPRPPEGIARHDRGAAGAPRRDARPRRRGVRRHGDVDARDHLPRGLARGRGDPARRLVRGLARRRRGRLFGSLPPPDPATAEDGLTVVRRRWRRRGLAEALKRAELAWAAENGIREVVTWTQRGNEGMRALNERLGYTYRSVSVSVSAPLDRIAL